MKVLIYDESNIIVNIIEDIKGEIQTGDDYILWSNGCLKGIKKDFILVDDEEICEIGDDVGNIALDKIKKKMIEQVNMNVHIACTRGITSTVTGYSYETEIHDQNNFSMRLQMIMTFPEKYPDGIKWKIANGETILHTIDEFVSVCNELDDFITPKLEKGWEIKENIRNAQSVDELEMISLEVE